MTHTPRPPTHSPAPMPEDSLVASYHAAVAELDKSDNVHAEGPSPQVRANVQAYANQLAQARAESSNASQSIAGRAGNSGAESTLDAEKPAANDSRWKIRALASIAIFGLSGLLFMQWNYAPPDERDVAFSAVRPAPPAALGKPDKAEAAAPVARVPIAPPAPAPVIATAPASPAATDQANQTLPAAPAPTQARSTENDTQTQATTGASSNAKKIKREATRSDSEASATAAPTSVADSAKDKAESKARSAAPAPLPTPAAPADSAAAPKPDAAMAQSGAVGSAPAAMAKAAPPAAPAAATAPLAEANTAPRTAAAAPSASPAPAAAARARSSAYDDDYPDAAPQRRLQLQTVPSSPNNALFTAIRNKDAAALQQALNEGADKNAKRNGTPAITLCVQAGLADMVQLLVNAAADVNAVDAQGITPLAHARERGLAQIVSILLKAGAKYDTNKPPAQ